MSDIVHINDLYENAPCGYFSFLPESGKIIKANKTFLSLVGVDKSEVENLNFVDLLHKGNMIYYEMIFLPSIKMHGFINELSFDILKKDGTRFPGLINAVAATDEQNNLIAVNAISFQEKWEEAQTNNSVFEMHVRLKNQSSKDDWYLLLGIPYVQDLTLIDQTRSWLGTLTNINYQIQSLQIKDDFISIASHELKTPLAVVKSSLQLLQNIAPDQVN